MAQSSTTRCPIPLRTFAVPFVTHKTCQSPLGAYALISSRVSQTAEPTSLFALGTCNPRASKRTKLSHTLETVHSTCFTRRTTPSHHSSLTDLICRNSTPSLSIDQTMPEASVDTEGSIGAPTPIVWDWANISRLPVSASSPLVLRLGLSQQEISYRLSVEPYLLKVGVPRRPGFTRFLVILARPSGILKVDRILPVLSNMFWKIFVLTLE